MFVRLLSRILAAGTLLCLAFSGAASQRNYDPGLWVVGQHALVRFSAIDGSELTRINRHGPPPYAAAESATDGELWVLFHRELDAWSADGRELISARLPKQVHVNGPHSSLAVDTRDGILWLTGYKSLYRLDLSGNLLGGIALSHDPDAIVLDSADSYLWVAGGDHRRRSVTAYDSGGNASDNFVIDGHGRVGALAYARELRSLWVLRGHSLYRYATSDGSLAARTKLPWWFLLLGRDEFLAPDGSGAVWVAAADSLLRVDASGAVDFAFAYVPGLLGRAVSLVADPADHSCWLSSRYTLVHVAANGTVLQILKLYSHRRHHRPIGPVRALTLWADTAPPALSFIAPTEASFVATTLPPLIMRYRDRGAGVDFSSFAFTANGQSISAQCTPPPGTVPAAGTATCALAVPLDEGGQILGATVADLAGNVSGPATRSFTVDTVPPTIAITQPNSQYTNDPHLVLKGHLSETGTLTVNGEDVAVGLDFGFSDPLNLTEGDNAVTLAATDIAGNPNTLTRTITLDTIPPQAPILGLISISRPDANGQITVTGKSGAVEGWDTVTITNTRTGESVTVTANADGSFRAIIVAEPSDKLMVKATDEAGNATPAPRPISVSNLPPKPGSVAPPLSKTGITPFADSTAFLYTGANPIQTAVAPGAITPERAAVIRGLVLDSDGNPLSGVRINILRHPELGHTLSRADGKFDIAVNGGGSLTVVYRLNGYTEVERTVKIAWNDYAWAPNVVLLPLAAPSGVVSFGPLAPKQFIAGPTTRDTSGSRQISVFVPAGTTLTANLSDGSTQPLTGGALHLTEYTVGSEGQAAMPIVLPPYSQYTYAVGMQLDESLPAGTQSVRLSRPLYAYVNDFLDFPVGIVIPSGRGDFSNGEWQASPNGQVIQILGVDAQGEVEVDVDGSGQAADAQTLAALGFGSAELKSLATQFQPGQKLWRVPLPALGVVNQGATVEGPNSEKHSLRLKADESADTTPPTFRWAYDFNLVGFYRELSAIPSYLHKLEQRQCNGPCCHVKGCIVGAVNRTLGERLPVTGTPYALDYASGTTLDGTKDARELVIQLSGAYNARQYLGLQAIRLEVDVAGERFVKYFPPEPNQTYVYVWNGLDGYGRSVTGTVNARVTIGFVTSIVYVLIHPHSVWSWASPVWEGGQDTAVRNGVTSTVSKILPPITLHNPVQGADFGRGWHLDVYASYDSSVGKLYNGDGSTRSVRDLAWRSRGLVSNLARGAPIAPAANGNVITLTSASLVSVTRNGEEIRLTDIPPGAQIVDLRYGANGALYALDAANGQIDQIEGVEWAPVISGLTQPRAFVPEPGGGFLIAACGAIFSAQVNASPVRVAGLGCDGAGDSGDGGPALIGKINPTGIGLTSTGNVIFIQHDVVGGVAVDRIRQISANGTLSTIAGGASTAASGVQSPVAATSVGFGAISGIMVRTDGVLLIAAGSAVYFDRDGMLQPPQLLAPLKLAHVSLAPSGVYLLTTDSGALWQLAPGLPKGPAAQYTIAAPSGHTVDTFDAYGHETGVYDTITGAKLISFQYDSGGRLIGITDVYGRTTTIQRGTDGRAEAIVAPEGQTTTLSVDGNGNLTTVVDPAGDSWQMSYSGALLSQFADPDGRSEHYSWDDLGHLTKVAEPNGGGWAIQASAPSSLWDAIYGPQTITLTSGEGHVTKYVLNSDDCASPLWFLYCGQSVTAQENPDGTERLTAMSTGWVRRGGQPVEVHYRSVKFPDGTYATISGFPSPRFGAESPITSIQVLGNHLNRSLSVLTEPGNPLVVSSLTETLDDNGHTYMNHYDAESHKWTRMSPAGRVVTTTVDALDRPVAVLAPTLATVAYAWDAQGRLAAVTVGSGDIAREVSFAYYTSGPAKGWLQSVTGPLGRTIGYAYDPAGRITAETLPDGEVVGFGYDAVGNLTSVVPPSRPAHGLSYTPVNLFAGYAPPAVTVGAGAVHYSYNLDRQLTGIELPSGEDVTLQYNSGGQLTTMTIPAGQYQYGYDATTGQLRSLGASADGEALGFSWNRFLFTGMTWSGPVKGSLAVKHDSDFRVTALDVDGNSVAYSYGSDGLLVMAKSPDYVRAHLDILRAPDNGRVERVSLHAGHTKEVTTAFSYDHFGELTGKQAGFSQPEQLGLQLSVSPATATAPSLNVEGALPGAAELDICVSDLRPCSTFNVAPDGSVSGGVSLLLGNNDLGIRVFDAAHNLIAQGQTSVAYQPATPPYAVYELNAVGPDGSLYFTGSSRTQQGSQFVLPPGAESATAPTGLQAANNYGNVQLAVAQDGSVYYMDANEILWHWTSGGTLVSLADLSNYYPSTLAAGTGGSVYFTLFGSESVYRVDASGVVSAVDALTDCSNGMNPNARTGARLPGDDLKPNSIPVGYSLTVVGSAAGIFVGCENADQTIYVVHKIAADGSVTAQATSPLFAPQFAAGPDGNICFGDGSATSIDCVAPDGNENDYPLAGELDSFGLDGTGTLYYSANDTNGNLMLWRWTAGGSVALLPSASPEPSTLTLTGTDVTPPGVPYAATYDYNKAGQVTSKTVTMGGAARSWSYDYDDNERLVSVTHGAATTTYGYDANGNRVRVNGASVATYNARDQLLVYGDSSYNWNADGELSAKVMLAGTTHYSWNALGELTDVSLPDGTAIHYIYDGLGRRMGKERNGALVAGYLYAGSRVVAETDAAGNMIERFVYATRSNVPDYLVTYSGEAATGIYRIVSDHAGSVRLVVDASKGAVVERIDYDAWGNITADTNPGFQPFAFAGGLYDADTGLVHFGARDYDPETGRWISRDPILFAGGDPNLYRYVVDDPVNLNDASGLIGLNSHGFGPRWTQNEPTWFPMRSWSLSISTYYIIGGSVTVGVNPDQSGYFGGQIGLGFGGGLDFALGGHSPGWKCGAKGAYTTRQNSVSGGVGLGPFSYSGGWHQNARALRGGYGPWQPGGGLAISPEGPLHFHVGAHVSSGFYATFGNGSECGCQP